jgi:hypothetical protein
VEILIGAGLALSLGISATFLGLDRDRVFYPLDFFHGRLIANPGVPAWWPLFCLSFDVMAAAYLAWLLARSKVCAAAS